jgi:hypothetical protein
MKSSARANAKATKAFRAGAGFFRGCEFGGFFCALKKKQQ